MKNGKSDGMRVGIPKGLLYCQYHPFFETFFSCLGAEMIVSEETNKNILNLGVQTCVDEACLPVKIFHGHVASIKDDCDLLVIPRIMQIFDKEFICPKFCGLPEMVLHSIPGIPKVTLEPLFMHNDSKLLKWCVVTGSTLGISHKRSREAFFLAQKAQSTHQIGICEQGKHYTVMLAGHPYILHDAYLNMGIVKKLRRRGIGIVTEEFADSFICSEMVSKLIKKPFWTFQRRLYGAATAFCEQQKIDGIVYLSSFACGIDSVIIDIIRYHVGEFPMLVIKLDEHTGEAGIDTRLEAFMDMLERRVPHEANNTTPGRCLYRSQNTI